MSDAENKTPPPTRDSRAPVTLEAPEHPSRRNQPQANASDEGSGFAITADVAKLKQAIGVLASHQDEATQAQVAELLN